MNCDLALPNFFLALDIQAETSRGQFVPEISGGSHDCLGTFRASKASSFFVQYPMNRHSANAQRICDLVGR